MFQNILELKMIRTLFLISLVVIFSLAGQAFLRKGAMKFSDIKITRTSDVFDFVFNAIQNQFILIGLCFSAVGVLFWIFVLSQYDLTFAFPLLTGVGYILLFMASWLFLREDINAWRIIGTIIILCGTLIVFIFGK